MSNEEQIAYWNGEAGERWALADAMMARLLEPVALALLEHAQVGDCRAALDVGCGGGSQSLLLAAALGPDASVTGADISAPLLEVARNRQAGPECAPVQFLQADAASHEFPADSFDLLFSRFGVMFFDDPSGAFGNLHRAMQPGGKLAFCCWQPLQANEWVRLPLGAALAHLPPPPAPEPDAPGPFAFADPERVRSVLSGAGFSEIELHSHQPRLRFGESGSLLESARELATIGPVSRLLADVDEATREKVYSAIAEVLTPFYQGKALELEGATWFVTAIA